MSKELFPPRFSTASGFAGLACATSGFWTDCVHQCDVFAYQSATSGKGGPFGAQLWIVHEATRQYFLISQEGNAVVSKGIASAHAEAENLNPHNRRAVVKFLQERPNCLQWKVVQVSSGESCHSCRSKQILFAEELVARRLLEKGNFCVLFKASYEQTARDAGFNDLPYDITYRLLDKLRLLDPAESPDESKEYTSLVALPGQIENSEYLRGLCEKGELIYVPVQIVTIEALPDMIRDEFLEIVDVPFAVVMDAERSTVLGMARDTRGLTNNSPLINEYEKCAIPAALVKASQHQKAEGIVDSWNLRGAVVFTNIPNIGPLSYAETMWFNVSLIVIVNPARETVLLPARELSSMTNREAFKRCAADYSSVDMQSLRVGYIGAQNESSVAHNFWKVKIQYEELRNKTNLLDFSKTLSLKRVEDGCDLDPCCLGEPMTPVQRRTTSHYNGVIKSPTLSAGSPEFLGSLPAVALDLSLSLSEKPYVEPTYVEPTYVEPNYVEPGCKK